MTLRMRFAALAALLAGVAGAQPPLTARVEALPRSHDGREFTFELHLSEEVDALGYRTVMNSLAERGGMTYPPERLVAGSNRSWRITVKPYGHADVAVVFASNRACRTSGAICTADGRRLSNRIEFTVRGPPIDKWGAIAWTMVGGSHWWLGMSGNYEQQPDAEWEARRACMFSDPVVCNLALVLEDECGAAAVGEDPDLDLIHLGFGKANDEMTARNRARADCHDSGGASCTVELSGCSLLGAERSRTDSAEGPSTTVGVTPPDSPDFLLDGPDCRGQPEGSQCWMELSNQPGCYVWNYDLQPSETATWTGGCSGGRADGQGRFTWEWPGNRQEFDGGIQQGRLSHGHSVQRFESGTIQEGPYVDGERSGHWVIRWADGGVSEGPYVNGERNGHWVQHSTSGSTAEGPFVDGTRHGRWTRRFPDGQVESGPYVDGEQHGRWRVDPPNGDTFYISFVRGVRQQP